MHCTSMVRRWQSESNVIGHTCRHRAAAILATLPGSRGTTPLCQARMFLPVVAFQRAFVSMNPGARRSKSVHMLHRANDEVSQVHTMQQNRYDNNSLCWLARPPCYCCRFGRCSLHVGVARVSTTRRRVSCNLLFGVFVLLGREERRRATIIWAASLASDRRT